MTNAVKAHEAAQLALQQAEQHSDSQGVTRATHPCDSCRSVEGGNPLVYTGH